MPPDFERIACNLAQNYKLSYKGVREGFHNHVLQTFDNSYWCASYNGAVNVSIAVNDDATNRFFETTFAHKWATEYLLLFIATIHQKYAVQKYLDELGELACPRYDYAQMKQLLMRGEVMQEKPLLFPAAQPHRARQPRLRLFSVVHGYSGLFRQFGRRGGKFRERMQKLCHTH